MNKRVLFIITLTFLLFHAHAQCDQATDLCKECIRNNYISDGQSYWALLNNTDVAEFQTTLFANNTYRIAACGGTAQASIIYKIFDQERNLLFSNQEKGNTQYWDFFIENTISVNVEAELDRQKSNSGCGVIVIGFKK
jgi:hypothetical protein